MNSNKYQVGMVLNAVSATLDSQKTHPPERYNESSLMEDMMAAYKFATTEVDRELLKSIAGIGTSRTRDVIIKNFIERGFVIREKKGKIYELKVSLEGRRLLGFLPDPIKDVTLTAKWERALAMIGSGTAKPEHLREKVNSMLTEIVRKALPVKAKVSY